MYSRSLWLSICLMSVTICTIAIVIVVSLIPIYFPSHNLNDIGDGTAGKNRLDIVILIYNLFILILVLSPNLTLTFGSNIIQAYATFNNLIVVNAKAIARQVTLVFLFFFYQYTLSISWYSLN